MQRLANPLHELRAHYDVVIVGSGYGGAVAACRLARARKPEAAAPVRVCVLERGREFQPGEYPDTLGGALAEVQLTTPRWRLGRRTGLYDFRLNENVSVFQGCGLGGTSLVNANVMIAPRTDFAREGWPGTFRQGDPELRSGYRRAWKMLSPSRYPQPILIPPPPAEPDQGFRWPELKKLSALREAAPRETPATRAWIAVSFETRVNDHQVQQHACLLCGDCVTGCNFGAKNTLIMNYLPDAKRHGAEIFCEVGVRWLERLSVMQGGRSHERWVVHFELLGAGRQAYHPPEMFVTADTVVLAAGSLGSTEILLRSTRHGLVLSDQLGSRFHGNGDAISFGYNTDSEIRGIGLGYVARGTREPVGPTITGLIDRRSRDRLLVQEGAIPSALSAVARFFFPVAALVAGSERQRDLGETLRKWSRGLVSLVLGFRRGALRYTQTFLVMGEEQSAGALRLVRDRLRVSWPGAGSQNVLMRARRLLRSLTFRLGGAHLVSPFWSRVFGRRLVTVHPLGGCPMADTAAEGVVNDQGQVFNASHGATTYYGLYVCDGAIIPRALGANPLWTIAALAERTAVLLAKQRHWVVEGLDRPDQPGGPASTRPSGRIGIRFSERMVGTYEPRDGPSTGIGPFEFVVTIVSHDLEALVRDEAHPASILGVARAPGLADGPLMINEGTFNLFVVDPAQVETREMRYEMMLTAVDGKQYHFKGAKVIHDQPFEFDLWKDLTRLPYVIREGGGRGRLVGRGELRIHRSDLWKIVASAEITNARTGTARWRERLRFAAFYATTLYKLFGWPLEPPEVTSPYRSRRRLSRPVLQPTESVHRVVTPDSVEIELRRYRGGDLGPVMLAPGFAMSTYAFTLETTQQNITRYLMDHGYDVWLLDYRASERTAGARTQFTADDIARYDYPTAVREVRAHTGQPPQVIGHCLASGALLMSLLKGYLHEGGVPLVRSVIGCAFFTHIDHPWLNRLKAFARGADLFWLSGFWPRRAELARRTLNSDFDTDSPFSHWIWDRLLHLYPTRERCRNPSCRRILFLYGEVYQHALLNADTHDAAYDMFDVGNLTAFRHLLTMIRHGRIVSHRGRNEYLTRDNAQRYLDVPVSLLQGMNNGIFRPAGGERSIRWLKANGRYPERYRIRRIRDYGHLDVFIGRDAYRDTYPVILQELQAGEAIARQLMAQRRASPVV